MDTPYTKLRPFQYRGPSTSDDYNARIRENYRDIVSLLNQSRVLREIIREGFGQLIKDQDFMGRYLTSLQGRISTLENSSGLLSSTLHDPDNTEVDRFNNTPFQVKSASRLVRETQYGLVILPRSDANSLSKLSFTDQDGNVEVPSNFEIRADGDPTSADTSNAIIDTSDPVQAVAKATGRIWERNVIVNAPNGNGAIMTVYLRVPIDLFTTANSNALIVNPFPLFGADLLEVAVTTSANVFLQDSDGYTPLNANAHYSGITNAIGWVPPGGWVGDTINSCPPRAFYFDPAQITGVRLKLRQQNYYQQGSQYVYSYGCSLIDLRYDKFLSSGVTMVKVTPPTGHTFSSITDVQPQIYNVAEAEVPDVFSYRVIWETAFNSGVYTLTPVPNSQRVWVEVTLNQTANGGTPALSGLLVSYT